MRPLDHSNLVNQVFKPMLVKAELGSFRLYDLRHTCATLMIKANIHVKVLRTIRSRECDDDFGYLQSLSARYAGRSLK